MTDEPGGPGEDEAAPSESLRAPARELSDAREMRALTHPVRLALIEVLGTDGPMTATEAGDRIGESASSCSFHLRQLEKYGFVEEAGGGEGRRRPWRLVNRTLRFSGAGDTESSIAANELSSVLRRRWLARHEEWIAVQRLAPEWSEHTGASEHVVFVTPEELEGLRQQVFALFDRFQGRLVDPSLRPPGSRAIESVTLMHPLFAHDMA